MPQLSVQGNRGAEDVSTSLSFLSVTLSGSRMVCSFLSRSYSVCIDRLSGILPSAQATWVKTVQSVFGSCSLASNGKTTKASPVILIQGAIVGLGFWTPML